VIDITIRDEAIDDRVGVERLKSFNDFAMLILRIMANNPNWEQSPNHVTKPGMEEAVMGDYLPKGEYTNKVAFERAGTN